MDSSRNCVSLVLAFFTVWVRYGFELIAWVFPMFRRLVFNPVASRSGHTDGRELKSWEKSSALRIYSCGNEESLVTVQTRTHSFQVDLGKLSECSDYFRALSESRMKETTEHLIHLEHIPSALFHSLLEFTFLQCFDVSEEDLLEHIEMGSYLLAQPFLTQCLATLLKVLSPQNCQMYLDFSRAICCEEMLHTIHRYLSTHLLELPCLTRSLELTAQETIIRLRSSGTQRLCALKKENLTARNFPQLEGALYLYSFDENKDDVSWSREARLPFVADKWCFTTAVLHNYLFLIGGYRQKVKRGFEFQMASFRYNPCTNSWVSVAPLIKHRRHFSTAVCEGYIFAVGGWYLDTLVAPDSSTVLYTAVERYDPWTDTWAFVSSLPLNDFLFTMSLSHDIPLTSVLHDCIYVTDSWSELLPTLTRADAEIPSLYFFGATDKLHLIGGNNHQNVVTSFCVESRKWEEVQATEKITLAGQGTILNNEVYMPAAEQNSFVRLNLQSLSTHMLPPLPISSSYEALFHLFFPW
nr:PREDICTED: kelch-like protein diablo isoform X2 [Lepisosteus oculatus]